MPGRLLLVLRLAWLALAAPSLGLALAGLGLALSHPALAGPELLARVWAEAGIPLYLPLLTLLVPNLLVCTASGVFLFWRRSDDWVALLLALPPVMLGGVQFIFAVHRAYPSLPGPGLLVNIGCLLLFLNLYVFPDGRFVPAWSRWPVLAVLPVLSYLDLGGLIEHLPDVSSEGPLWRVQADLVLALGLSGGGLLAQIHRYRSVSTAVQRQQTKWMLFGFASLVTALIAILGPSLLCAPSEWFGWVTIAATGPVLVMPVALAVAVLRYRLWDIDVLINRALVYGALTACIVALYVLVVGGFGAVLQTSGNLVISLLATGVIAVLFQPLRERLQRAVNRVLYGQRDEPYAVLSRLGQCLEATLAPEAVLPGIVETVREALRLPYAAIALRQPDGLVLAAASGHATGDELRMPLAYQHDSVGELRLAPRGQREDFGPADRRLLTDLARQAGAAVYAVRLNGELQRSRERLVNAREEERRRLRRDLHDELAPTLAALALSAATARDRTTSDPATRALLDELYAGLRGAVGDIRRLVYELRPPALDELGLVAALRERAAQYTAADGNGLHVVVEAPEQVPPLPAAVEVAAYRVVQEALMNVVRHAQAHTCTVRLALADGLQIEVSDDGTGLPEVYRAGVGLRSMRERALELGGRCSIEPRPEGGTHVSVWLPVASTEGGLPRVHARAAALTE